MEVLAQNPCHCLCYSDINECTGDHGCHHLCNNTDGSFHCYCDPGFMFDSDGITCEGNHTLHQLMIKKLSRNYIL